MTRAEPFVPAGLLALFGNKPAQGPQTVDEALGGVMQAIDNLDNVAKYQSEKSKAASATIAVLDAERTAADAEAIRAKQAAEGFRKLVGR